MKLRNRKSYMTSLPEGEAPKNRKANITQMIYFLILIAAVGYLIFIFSKRYWYYEELGVVEVEKTIISSSRGGRIASINITEGKNLKAKDKIAAIEASRSDCVIEHDGRIDKLRFEIDSNIAKRNLLRTQLAAGKQAEKKYELRRALELDRGLIGNTERIKREQETVANDIALLSKQIVLQNQRLEKLQQYQKQISLPKECYNEQIQSPFDAVVTAVHKRSKEFAQRGEAIVTLIKHTAPVRVEVYLDRDVLKYIKIGNKLDLEFPDGTKSQGSIREINSAAYTATERQLDHYKPYESDIRVHLQPIDDKTRNLWLGYDRMEVKVRGRK